MTEARLTHDEWLALTEPEDVLDPDLSIFDPHHHLWDRGGHRFLQNELLAAIDDGHRIIGTAYVECLNAYRPSGPDSLKPVGETEFVVGHLPSPLQASHGPVDACAAIIGYADLSLGDKVAPVLEAHIAAGNGRLKGIRYAAAWDEHPKIHSAYPTTKDMLLDPLVQQGIRLVGAAGLSYDSWQYFTQLDELAAAADACPDTPIIIGHLGGVIGIGPYEEHRQDVFTQWKAGLSQLANRPNIFIKLGGLGMALAGFRFRRLPRPPSSIDLAEAWRPYIETAIEIFGPGRAMFESNYPVDMVSGKHRNIYNAFKHLTSQMSAEDKHRLFMGTAMQVYQIKKSA